MRQSYLNEKRSGRSTQQGQKTQTAGTPHDGAGETGGVDPGQATDHNLGELFQPEEWQEIQQATSQTPQADPLVSKADELFGDLAQVIDD